MQETAGSISGKTKRLLRMNISCKQSDTNIKMSVIISTDFQGGLPDLPLFKALSLCCPKV
jgi:hypothetical protein